MAQGERRSEFLPYSPKGDSRKTYEFEIKVWTTEETLVRTYQKRGANRGSKISKHLNTRTNVWALLTAAKKEGVYLLVMSSSEDPEQTRTKYLRWRYNATAT